MTLGIAPVRAWWPRIDTKYVSDSCIFDHGLRWTLALRSSSAFCTSIESFPPELPGQFHHLPSTRPCDSAAQLAITRPLPRHCAPAITALPLPTTTYAHCSRRETMAPTPNLTSGATTSCPGGRATPARCSGCPCSRRRPVTVPCGNQPVRRRRDVSISTQATTTGSTAAARASSSRPSRRRPADSRPTTT